MSTPRALVLAYLLGNRRLLSTFLGFKYVTRITRRRVKSPLHVLLEADRSAFKSWADVHNSRDSN